MNKTLLLIIVDFLFLNLIALTRWEKAEPIHPRQAPVPEMAGNTPRDQDLVELMRLSLEDEHSTREQFAAQLQASQAELQAREQNLTQLQSAKVQLESSLAATQQNVRELNQRAAAASQDAAMTKERLAQILRDLEAKQAEASRQQQQIAGFEKQQAEAQQRIEGLNVAVKVAEQEKVMLRENLEEAKQQVESERQERQKALVQTGQLAEGVGRLAEKSGEIAQEIRENRPINANVLFNDFLANRVFTTLTASRKTFFGTTTRQKETKTVLVTDGKAVYALLHARDTPFPVTIDETPVDWARISGQFGRPPLTASVAEFQFLSLDPRIIVIPVDTDLAARLGVKVYQTALEPFKFTEAVLVSSGGKGYGEVSFKLDARTPQYVRMDNRLIKHLAGEFTPSAGDLVFSKTGELLGIMVNSDYCAMIDNFLPAKTIKTGDSVPGQHTGEILAGMVARLQGLPSRLQ
jgi:predicted  nucleic acid-binding Zn-ribbon protein